MNIAGDEEHIVRDEFGAEDTDNDNEEFFDENANAYEHEKAATDVLADQIREAHVLKSMVLLQEELERAEVTSPINGRGEFSGHVDDNYHLRHKLHTLDKELSAIETDDDIRARADKRFAGLRECISRCSGSVTGQGKANRQRRHCINTPCANAFFGGAIILNAVFIGVETDIRSSGEDELASDRWKWFLLESAFLVIFLIELVLRIRTLSHWQDLGKDYWNLFDLGFVCLGIFDTWMLQFIVGNSGGRLVRFIRLIRLLRVLRIVRLFRFFKELTQLAQGIWAALQAMIWAALLICVVIYVCAVVVTNTLGKNNASDIQLWFGSLGSSLFTLFQLMTLEDWPNVVRSSMVQEKFVWAFFLPFIMFTNFAMLNVITAVVVEKVFTIARAEAAEEARRGEKKRKHLLRKLKMLFNDIDTNEDGVIDLEEFRKALKRPDILGHFMELGIGKYEADDLFACLDVDNNSTLSVAEFVEGCLRVHGPAQSKHLLQVQYDIYRTKQSMQADLKELGWYVRWVIRHLSYRFDWRKAKVESGGDANSGAHSSTASPKKILKRQRSTVSQLSKASKASSTLKSKASASTSESSAYNFGPSKQQCSAMQTDGADLDSPFGIRVSYETSETVSPRVQTSQEFLSERSSEPLSPIWPPTHRAPATLSEEVGSDMSSEPISPIWPTSQQQSDHRDSASKMISKLVGPTMPTLQTNAAGNATETSTEVPGERSHLHSVLSSCTLPLELPCVNSSARQDCKEEDLQHTRPKRSHNAVGTPPCAVATPPRALQEDQRKEDHPKKSYPGSRCISPAPPVGNPRLLEEATSRLLGSADRNASPASSHNMDARLSTFNSTILDEDVESAVATLQGIRNEQVELRQMLEGLLREFRGLRAQFAEFGCSQEPLDLT